MLEISRGCSITLTGLSLALRVPSSRDQTLAEDFPTLSQTSHKHPTSINPSFLDQPSQSAYLSSPSYWTPQLLLPYADLSLESPYFLTMTSQSALELLLPELQRRILSQTDSFESLYSLIRASPRLYQVFRLNKQITLSNLACRQFDPATIRAALGIEKLRQIEHPPFSRDTVLQFFNLEYDEPTDFPQPILPLPVSTNLRKLDGTIRFLTNDYVQNTLPIVTQLSSSEHPAIRTEYKRDCGVPRPTISRSESFRLRRAFCRFETYRQLFSRCSLDINHDLQRCPSDPSLTVFEQAEKFFQHMPAHQAAEVACVRDYLHRRLRGVFDQVEDEVVQELQEECPNPMDRRQALEWAYYDTGGRLQDVAEDMHYFGYLGKIDQRHHIEHLTSLGLPYVRRLLESSGDERRNLLLRTGAGCYKQEDRDFVSAALGVDSFSGQRKMYRWRGRNIKSCLDERTKLDLPPGWLWAHKDNDYHSVVDLYAKGLRDWGYVFWDLERLQTAGVLDLE